MAMTNVTIQDEIWKLIPGMNDLYEVSSLGEIRRVLGVVKNNIDGGVRKVGGKVLAQKTKRNGYKEVNLYPGPQRSVMTYVHRAVVLAFIGDIAEGYVVNHKDGNKANNALSNLEIVSYAGNSQHAYATGLSTPKGMKGSAHHKAKLTEEIVVRVRARHAELKSIAALALEFPFKKSTLAKVVYRDSWKHI